MFRLSRAFTGSFMTRGESTSNACPVISDGDKSHFPRVLPPPPRHETPPQSLPRSSPHFLAELGVPPGCSSTAEPVSDSSNRLNMNHSSGEDKAISNMPQPSSEPSSRTLGSLTTRPVISSDAESPSPGVPPLQTYGMHAEPLTLSSPCFGGNVGAFVRSLSPAASVLNSSNGINGSLPYSSQKSQSKRHECKMLPQKRTLEGDGDGSKEPSKRASTPTTLSIISSPDTVAVASLSLHASPIDAVQAMAHANELQLCTARSRSSDSHHQRRIPPDEVNVLAEELHSPMETVLSGMESSHKIVMDEAKRTHKQEIESLRNKLLKEVDDIKRCHNDELDRFKFQLGAMQTDSAHPQQGVDLNREKHLKEVDGLKDELNCLRSQFAAMHADSAHHKQANDLNREKHLKEVEDLKKNNQDALDHLRSQLTAMAGDSSGLKQGDDRNSNLREVDDPKRSHNDELDCIGSQLVPMPADSARLKQEDDLKWDKHLSEVDDLKRSHKAELDDLRRANSILNQEMVSLRDKHKKEVDDLKRNHKDALDGLQSRIASMAGDSSRLKHRDDRNRDKHLREVDDLKRSHKADRSQLSAMQADSAHRKQVDDLNSELMSD